MSGRIHELKCWPEYFAPLARGEKTFEVRRDDRGFSVGDKLVIREWKPGENHIDVLFGDYTGRGLEATISYVLHGGNFGIDEDYAVLGLKDVKAKS